ncbi:MAG: hypothetical protein ACD_64C00159G0002 [uncultured bacterium]|nr:MAG: hypothetical protein ACD_64C00159G0002 [uncultured bacterium]HLE76400.1 septum formation initiator family protein [Candidatus Babeliales bacterium]
MQKKTMLRLFFVAEIILFGWFYYHGARGVQAIQHLKQENDHILAQLQEVKQELQALDNQIIAWKEDSFFAEKIAREELHMAHAGDEIYLLD